MSANTEDLPEAAVDPQTSDILGWIGHIVYVVLYPIGISLYYVVYYIAFAGLFVLKLLYRPLEFILLPIVYLVQFLWRCFLAPFQFLAKFETLYIYLGVAALVGSALGLLIFVLFDSLSSILGLKSSTAPVEESSAGRTAKQYREEKRKQKAKAEAPLMSPGPASPGYLSLSDGMRKGNRVGRGLISQTIMEEMDSDY